MIRHYMAWVLHRLNVHAVCRVRPETDIVGIRLDDGTIWKPDLNGFPFGRPVHY